MFSDILKRSFLLERPQKRAIQMLADVWLIICCFALAMALRMDSWPFLVNSMFGTFFLR